MNDAPRLEWRTYPNCLRNTSHEAKSFASSGSWAVFSYHQMDVIRWHAKGSKRVGQDGFSSADAAKAWCQAREDEAWRAANPPREYTDTEILDAIDRLGMYVAWMSNTYSVGGLPIKPAREAVSAFLRSIEGGPR